MIAHGVSTVMLRTASMVISLRLYTALIRCAYTPRLWRFIFSVSYCEADQRLCLRYTDSTISLLLKSEISSFCDCTGRFVSDLVGNPEDRFSCLESQLNKIMIHELLRISFSPTSTLINACTTHCFAWTVPVNSSYCHVGTLPPFYGISMKHNKVVVN